MKSLVGATILVIASILVACTSTGQQETISTLIPTQPVATSPTENNVPSDTPVPSDVPATPTRVLTTETVVTLEPVTLPLSEPGPYFVGTRSLSIVDNSRDGREIRITIYYPAKKEKDANGNVVRHNATADKNGAPYPLILTGPNSGDMLFQDHLASHGFVMAIVRFPDLDYGDNWGFGVIDHPRDMLFALDQLAANPPEGLEGIIDTDHVGASGYSWDGFFALALSGVRIDPDYYLAHCAQPPQIEPAMGATQYLEMTCSLSKQWDQFTAHVGNEITASEDGLWMPVTDERIRVTLPMAADGAWLYGERGLAAVDRPVLMIAPTADEGIPYPVETRFIFENLGTPHKSLISFVDKGHMMVFDPVEAGRMNHFATAYFGYYLQGREDYAEYFSESYISQFEDLVWGMYLK